MSSSKSNRSFRRSTGDKTRRARWLDAVGASGVSRGAMAWALILANRSNATAKDVFGRQIGQAKEIGCSDRQVRRYRKELEDAGLIVTRRFPFERREDGTIGRMFTNVYSFVVSVMKRKPRSNRAEGIDRSTSIPKGMDIEPHRKTIIILDDDFDPADFDASDGVVVASNPAPMALVAQTERVAGLRAALSRA